MDSSIKFKVGQLSITPEDIGTITEQDVIDKDTQVLNDAKAYADSLVVSTINDRGNYNPSITNLYPITGGSGAGGAIKKGNLWILSGLGVGVTTTINGIEVQDGDNIRALVDTPGQTNSNWAIIESNLGFVPEDTNNKLASISGLETNGNLYANIVALLQYFQQKLTASIFGTFLNSMLTKATPADADEVGYRNSVDGNFVKFNFQEFKTYLKAFFDGHYSKVLFSYNAGTPIVGVTTETVVATYTIPPNTIIGRHLEFYAMGERTNNNGDFTFRVRVSTTNVLPTGTTGLIYIANTLNSQNYWSAARKFIVRLGTLRFYTTTIDNEPTGYVEDNVLPGSQAFDTTVTNYMFFTVQNSSVTGNTAILGIKLTN